MKPSQMKHYRNPLLMPSPPLAAMTMRQRNEYFRSFMAGDVATPNDPKLSDGGAWRGSCGVRRRRDIQATKEERTDETRTS